MLSSMKSKRTPNLKLNVKKVAGEGKSKREGERERVGGEEGEEINYGHNYM